jgi:hypothetical protein
LRQGRRAKRYKRLHYVGGIIANDKQHYTWTILSHLKP